MKNSWILRRNFRTKYEIKPLGVVWKQRDVDRVVLFDLLLSLPISGLLFLLSSSSYFTRFFFFLFFVGWVKGVNKSSRKVEGNPSTLATGYVKNRRILAHSLRDRKTYLYFVPLRFLLFFFPSIHPSFLLTQENNFYATAGCGIEILVYAELGYLGTHMSHPSILEDDDDHRETATDFHAIVYLPLFKQITIIIWLSKKFLTKNSFHLF